VENDFFGKSIRSFIENFQALNMLNRIWSRKQIKEAVIPIVI